jgi:alkylhydroperoxidase/carboxymuconolactone decarboxylase family protein YurZ
MVTEYCWGHVWGREGLSLKERSMINLAMISALNRPHELKLHVRGALRNGLSREQIREILLQVGIYCGVPAAVDSFRLARSLRRSRCRGLQLTPWLFDLTSTEIAGAFCMDSHNQSGPHETPATRRQLQGQSQPRYPARNRAG